MKGQAFLDPSVTSTLVDQIKRRPFNLFRDEKLPLTRRELEVLESIVLGLTDKETAERLHISEHTVRTHAKSLYRKLGVSSRSQAAVHAVHQGIIDQEKLQR
jgi:DNA-binding NarL/FixJ family response regulator